MRVALLGAFPFPLPQGSQVYARDQARALARAGAELTLFCYGRGAGDAPADLEVVRIPRALSPRALRAGPSPAKPLADAALAARFAAAHRRRGYDVALAHNAEAALAGLLARPWTRVPVVYVAHTLFERELAGYARPSAAPLLDRLGRGIDRALAARCDAVLALSRFAAERLAGDARGPVERIPPGLDPAPDPDKAEIEAACARRGLAPGRFALYAGNLDGYQDLGDLAAAARALAGVPVVAITHARPRALEAVRVFQVPDAGEARALLFGAGVAVLPRRRPGGFPIKLLNYMEARRAIVAHAALADGLEHGVSAWLLGSGAGPRELAAAVRALLADGPRAERLGRAARSALEREHAWPALAARTLDWLGPLV